MFTMGRSYFGGFWVGSAADKLEEDIENARELVDPWRDMSTFPKDREVEVFHGSHICRASWNEEEQDIIGEDGALEHGGWREILR